MLLEDNKGVPAEGALEGKSFSKYHEYRNEVLTCVDTC